MIKCLWHLPWVPGSEFENGREEMGRWTHPQQEGWMEQAGMAPAHCSGLCFLQIMIEFCPGGAVDAIMLGKSL